MNVLQPNKKTAIITLLTNGISQREIVRKVRVDRKTVRKYARMADKSNETQTATVNPPKSPGVATGFGGIGIRGRKDTGPRSFSLRRASLLDRRTGAPGTQGRTNVLRDVLQNINQIH